MKIRTLLVLAVLSLAVSLHAQDSVANTPVTPVQLTVPDVQVVTQSGERVAFNSGIVRDRIAVITGFFTNCTAFCPMTQERLSRLAKALGSRMGKDVIFVSVSVDPVNDTPERMKAWAEKFHLGPGWTLVSGNQEDVQTLLKSLGLYVEAQRHQSALIIGNQKNGWARVSSWASTEKLTQAIDDQKKGPATAAAK
jgi:cytochrome oxidase Cu insertion factor (SCO1/SenC/PrrC family)